MTISFKNSARSGITAAIGTSDTTISINSADWGNFMAGRAAGTEFYCTLRSANNREIVLVDVDASSSPNLSVSRGQEATIASEWPLGTLIYQDITAATLAFDQQTAFRQGAFNPNATLTSDYFGEKFYQSDLQLWWKSVAFGTQEWRLIVGEIFIDDVQYSPAPGSYGTGQTLTMTVLASGASIYYTDDGTDPDETDTLYTVPFVMPVGVTQYKARGFGANRWESPSQNITDGTYTITTIVENILLFDGSLIGTSNNTYMFTPNGTGSWTTRTNYPSPSQSYHKAAHTNLNQVYKTGGRLIAGGALLTDVNNEYTGDTWVNRAVMLRQNEQHEMLPFGSTVYVYGGLGLTNVVDEYTFNTWINRTNMPETRWNFGAGAFGGNGYVYVGDPSRQTCYRHTPPNTWVVRAIPPDAFRNRVAGAALGSAAYYTYGAGARFHREYTENTWTNRTNPPFPDRTAEGLGNSAQSKYYVMSGGNAAATNVEYVIDTWTAVAAAPEAPAYIGWSTVTAER